MHYQATQNLPDQVRIHLPDHAQKIFMAAFNNINEEYGEEERAVRVAWSAVKRDYVKGKEGQWRPKNRHSG